MKAYGGVEVQLQAFLNSALGDVASYSLFGHFTPEERTPCTQWIRGWADLRAGLDNDEEKSLLPLLAIKPRFINRPARSLVAIPTEVFRLSYITWKKQLLEKIIWKEAGMI
jgi:hypothetical protein